jgi:muramoyltetrapeptide carboxypeptidase
MKTPWSPLKKHSHVALVCTGSPCISPDHPGETQQYLEENYHLNIRFANETADKVPAIKRAEVFLDYLFDNNIEMIWSLRGGEGTADILPYIDQEREKISMVQPKILMGYSDFTPMLLYFAQHYGWKTIHGPAALLLSQKRITSASEKTTMDLLYGVDAPIIYDHLIPLNSAALANPKIQSQITGGSLSLTHVSLKDIWEIDMGNKIVLLEDVGEKTHKISRMLKHLHRIGKFSSAKALIFGDFFEDSPAQTAEEKEENRASMQRLLKWFANELECPVFQTDLFGHGEKNTPFVFNTNVLLENQKLIFDFPTPA